MKKLQYLILACSVGLTFSSCADPGERGSSTPIDSTNLNGTAPATYGATPADTVHPKYEGQSDSGLRANNASAEDSMKGRK